MIEYYLHFLIIFVILLLLRQYFTYKKKLALKYILTPLITLSVIATALFSLKYASVKMNNLLIIIGLTFSLIGDVLLMIGQRDFFIHGLLFFLLAQLTYISSFAPDYHFMIWNIAPAAVFIIFIIYFYKIIVSKSGKQNIPVLIYMLVISSMLYFAVARFNTGISSSSLLLSTGAFLFVISDILIAIDQFIKSMPNSTIIVWMLYAPAQLLIGLSCYYT